MYSRSSDGWVAGPASWRGTVPCALPRSHAGAEGPAPSRRPLLALRRGTVPRALLALSLLALASGCVSMDLPEPFVVLEQGGCELKAVTPDDARVWVRQRSVATNTTLAYWAEVLRNELVQNRGYTLVEEGTARDGDGVEGKEFVFEATVEGAPQRYLIAAFVHEGHACGFLWPWKEVCTVEFVAPKDAFAKLVDGVRKGIGTLEP